MPYFNKAKEHKTKIDFVNNRPVSVVAVFSPIGKFKPIFLRYTHNNGEEETLKISSIKYTKEYHDYIMFCCTVCTYERSQDIFLSFYYNECIWLLSIK